MRVIIFLFLLLFFFYDFYSSVVVVCNTGVWCMHLEIQQFFGLGTKKAARVGCLDIFGLSLGVCCLLGRVHRLAALVQGGEGCEGEE